MEEEKSRRSKEKRNRKAPKGINGQEDAKIQSMVTRWISARNLRS